MKRAIVVVLDSFGLGAAPDAHLFGDEGADTLGHIAEHCFKNDRPLRVPNMAKLGLWHAHYGATGKQLVELKSDITVATDGLQSAHLGKIRRQVIGS